MLICASTDRKLIIYANSVRRNYGGPAEDTIFFFFEAQLRLLLLFANRSSVTIIFLCSIEITTYRHCECEISTRSRVHIVNDLYFKNHLMCIIYIGLTEIFFSSSEYFTTKGPREIPALLNTVYCYITVSFFFFSEGGC